mmetsp:Transcript_15917/g.34488  ORF Transcript_15917/g.34488 Transcript_15917/m.34488 type:complete len:259 (-) Transcript_15917:882-1658(-)
MDMPSSGLGAAVGLEVGSTLGIFEGTLESLFAAFSSCCFFFSSAFFLLFFLFSFGDKAGRRVGGDVAKVSSCFCRFCCFFFSFACFFRIALISFGDSVGGRVGGELSVVMTLSPTSDVTPSSYSSSPTESKGIPEAIGEVVGEAEGVAVGEKVGLSVGSTDGPLVGAGVVGAALGEGVGTSDGAELVSLTGDALGAEDGGVGSHSYSPEVGIAHSFAPSPFDAHRCSSMLPAPSITMHCSGLENLVISPAVSWKKNCI